MTQVKYFFNELNAKNFHVLIELYFNIINGIKDFIFSDYKITLIVVGVLIAGTVISFLKRLIPLLIIGGMLILALFSPELIEQAKNMINLIVK